MKKTLTFFIISTFCMAVFAQNPTYQQKLYYSCKVWGFVKYYHSKVSNCEVNWDSVLVNTLPLIKNAVTNNDFNDALDTMLQAAGPMDIAIAPFPDTLAPDLKRNRDFSWISDPIFRNDIKVLLDTIKNNFRPHAICWVQDNDYTTSYQGWLVFPHDNPMTDTTLSANFPNENKRLLLIYKYWNILRYFNPYNYILDTPWDSTLYNNILSVSSAGNYIEFYLSLERISTFLNDAHVEGLTWSSSYYFPNYWSPKLVLRYMQNKYVVVKSGITSISPGDVIISVDGKTTTQMEDSLRPFISAGNQSVFRRTMCTYILCGASGSTANLICQDSLGNNHTFAAVRNYSVYSYSWITGYYPNDTLSTSKWKKWNNCNIGYVHMGNLQTADVNTMYAALQNTSAIIFDIRNYPNGTAWPLADLMYPHSMLFAKFTVPDVTYPGTFYRENDYLGVNGNSTAYAGKVIILCNQETQSQAEFTCMILGKIGNSVIVGSQTAGADGNVTYFNISPDIQAGFTTLGVFYPNGDSTQRIGIVPDSIVFPTAAGIRHGRDEVLEKALEIADCFLSLPDNTIKPSMNIFPNPASNNITIEIPSLNNVKDAVISIYNIEGELLLNQKTHSEKSEIDISDYAEGIYFVKVNSDSGIVVKKFVKE